MAKYVAFIFGGLIVIAAFFGIWHVLPPVGGKFDAYTEHLIFLFAGFILLGGFMMLPGVMLPAMKSIFGIIGPYIPVVGGRRATDPPAPPPSGGPQ